MALSWEDVVTRARSDYMQLDISMAMPSHLPDVLQLPLGFRASDRRTRHLLVFEQQTGIKHPLRKLSEIFFLDIRLRQNVGGNEFAQCRSAHRG